MFLRESAIISLTFLVGCSAALPVTRTDAAARDANTLCSYEVKPEYFVEPFRVSFFLESDNAYYSYVTDQPGSVKCGRNLFVPRFSEESELSVLNFFKQQDIYCSTVVKATVCPETFKIDADLIFYRSKSGEVLVRMKKIYSFSKS